ncbi:nucleotidyltransferase [Tepidibacter formicigenes]|jgi:predicted nucleotidyltransferase|uniref:tRNA(Met) cytidine acetate ligase n=1 Tax=Tepidibacter formicigenes DSM 15518 TaxID=1123349 RepID=A0A1M6L4Z0_9FIRM|nr:nucleotidyltransferase [Tepidibacter formicigenes]SHJ66174.1 Predicted nucleotidyltransferase [Tepidibacter formicigenes DSM 15518]
MKVLGLVVEYNPFHNGHLYHILESKKITNSTHTIAIMSGHFLQRGEPALFDKWTRAKMAVKSGVDLVIELPTLYSTQSAEFFSHGAINTLNSTKVVDSLCFGSEIGSADVLYKISEVLVNEPKEFKTELKKYLSDGLLFPVARSKSLFNYIQNNNILDIKEDELSSILNSSNNILGIEYIKSIIKLKSSIKPYTIKRIKSEYNSKDIETNICSATAIRELLKSTFDLDTLRKVVPKSTYDLINSQINDNFNPVFNSYFYELIIGTILREEKNIASYFEVNEGIENKIIDLALKTSSLEEFVMNIKSKRYTLTKIKRMLMNILLGIKKEDMLKVKNINTVPYVRILAFNNKGREIIKNIKQNSDIKLVNRLSNINFKKENEILNLFLKYDIKATNLYNLIYYNKRRDLLKGAMDYYISPIYIT